jgi:hypothetical protein
MFRRAIALLLLPTALLIGGWFYYQQLYPSPSFYFSPPTPPKTTSYDRQGVKKEIYFSNGEHWEVCCEKALLMAHQKGGWSEAWGEVKGTWDIPHKKQRTFLASEAEFFFSSHLLKAKGIEIKEEDLVELKADLGDFQFSSSPVCLLTGNVEGKGILRGEKIFFETPSLHYEEGKILTHEGGFIETPNGWKVPFTGALSFDGDLLEIADGNIEAESEYMTLFGHSLKAAVDKGTISHIILGNGVTLKHRLAYNSAPFQEAKAETLDLHLDKREGLVSAKSEERAFFVDKTHGVEMEVDALSFRWDLSGKIDSVEGIGEMTLSTQKGGNSSQRGKK